jgi:hypothetical protein
MAKMDDKYFEKALLEANEAAIKAGDEWMANAKPKYVVSGYEDSPLLDLCGNAHVRVRDGRTKFFKYLKKNCSPFGPVTVPLAEKYRGRQEHGLKVAIASAGLEVLSKKYGIKKLELWDYID